MLSGFNSSATWHGRIASSSTRGQGYSVRIYAPVGPHADLLAYLVRRLLEKRQPFC